MSSPDTLQAAVDNLIAELRRVWPPEAYDQARQVIDYLEFRLEQIGKQFTAAPEGYVAGGPISEGRSLPVVEAEWGYPLIQGRWCHARRWMDPDPESDQRVPLFDEYICGALKIHRGLSPHVDSGYRVAWDDGDAEVRPFGLNDEN